MNATLDCPGDMEEFRDIPGYPGYQISNYGNVFSRKLKRVIEAPTDKDGYLRIGLWNSQIKKNFRVHRLVAIAFIPNPENKPEVNHKDGNRTNANVSNLEWNTDKENNNHKNKELNMDATSLKFIGVGLMAFGMLGAAVGIGTIFGSLVNAISRNPSAADQMQRMAFIGAGLAEAMGLFSFVIAMLLIFT